MYFDIHVCVFLYKRVILLFFTRNHPIAIQTVYNIIYIRSREAINIFEYFCWFFLLFSIIIKHQTRNISEFVWTWTTRQPDREPSHGVIVVCITILFVRQLLSIRDNVILSYVKSCFCASLYLYTYACVHSYNYSSSCQPSQIVSKAYNLSNDSTECVRYWPLCEIIYCI